jgi:class 3 adenylate cyclase
MKVDSQAAALTAYVPNWVRRACRSWPDQGPQARASRGAILFLDLAGFSKQTAHLASFGPKGAEELSVILKNTFAPLVDVIDKDGGDIVAFVGDGIIAVWDSDNLVRDTQQATQCGLKLQRVNNTSTLFRMRVAIECGEIFYSRFGGTAGRSHYMVVGAPLASVGAAYRLAAPGDVVLCSAARETLGALVKSFQQTFR